MKNPKITNRMVNSSDSDHSVYTVCSGKFVESIRFAQTNLLSLHCLLKHICWVNTVCSGKFVVYTICSSIFIESVLFAQANLLSALFAQAYLLSLYCQAYLLNLHCLLRQICWIYTVCSGIFVESILFAQAYLLSPHCLRKNVCLYLWVKYSTFLQTHVKKALFWRPGWFIHPTGM